MLAAGRLNKRVTFQTAAPTADDGGGRSVVWGGDMTVWGWFRPERGRERVEAGRLSSALGGVLTVRSSSQTRALTEEARVLIDGAIYNIRSIANPDGRNEALEMTVEKGVAS